ncbi:interferon-induced protein 44 isoform X1 [Meriones unguiculatus]|uniref:interferon-induced protein 44 isoform X1 n=2 Tax=Meriones unguiculatus TaxID=10047 RepID=UPI000B4F36CC|nr:interferon-induced protein 44 isoform X1 [Meriones unguiculatus]XP_060248488.1 interferon-induced protein 44 isoform X1 [Meriones unguiculatus]
MAMRTRLTWFQEKCLRKYFGEKRFCLLYKASVQEFSEQDLLEKCQDQGPTMIVLYNKNCVVGVYLQEGFQEKHVSTTLFALQKSGFSECALQPSLPASLFYAKNLLGDMNGFFILLGQKKVTISSKICKILGLPPEHSTMSVFDCEAFRCEELLGERKIKGITLLQSNLLDALRTYKPYRDLVHQTRILLLGPIGAGKSNFINSVKSVFRGRTTHQALVGCDINGISDKYRTYSIMSRNDSGPLPFLLCDSLGLSENAGLHMDDLRCILNGHIPDRYPFNSVKPITPNHPNYIHDPLLKDKIHCVVFVFDANSVEKLSHGLVAKIKQVRKDLIKRGILHLALLTHVDSLDLITKGDLIDLYKCIPVLHKLKAVHRDFGFAFSDILMVSNYVAEWELDPVKDILILSALKEILHTANEFLEDLPSNTQVD